MPHKCMNCGETYPEDSDRLIDGCECGSSLFIFEKEQEEITEEEREEVKSEFTDIGPEDFEKSENIKFEFDLDSIIVEEEGVYTINITRLLDEIPLVIRKDEGVYHVNLPSAFEPDNAKLEEDELD